MNSLLNKKHNPTEQSIEEEKEAVPQQGLGEPRRQGRDRRDRGDEPQGLGEPQRQV